MSEQWGRWFADAPHAPAEPIAEQPEVVDEHPPADEPVAEYQSAADDEQVAEYEPVEGQVAEYEAAVDDEPVVDDQPVAELEPDDGPEDDSDPAVSSVYALRQRLGELEELPIEEHPARYEQLHAELTAALGQIDGGA